jgi:dihydrofolate reductase
VRSLLLDTLTLNICPIVLGSGLRLFDDTSNEIRLDLADATSYKSGVVRATYRPLHRVAGNAEAG